MEPNGTEQALPTPPAPPAAPPAPAPAPAPPMPDATPAPAFVFAEPPLDWNRIGIMILCVGTSLIGLAYLYQRTRKDLGVLRSLEEQLKAANQQIAAAQTTPRPAPGSFI